MPVICNKVYLKIKNEKDIVRDLNFILNDSDKLAVIGEEGNGKSTLLKYFYDQQWVESYTEQSGTFSPAKNEIGYLPQLFDYAWNETSILDFLLKDEIHSEINFDFYNVFHEIERFFIDFKIAYLLETEIKIKLCSGGEKIKLQIIKMLMRKPEVLLLDEPTNDLDKNTLEWFESYLEKTSIPLIFVTHDEQMIERIANQILHIEQYKRTNEMRFNYYKGRYVDYLIYRTKLFEKQVTDHIRTKREKERKEEILRKQHQQVEDDLNQAVRNPVQGRLLAKKMKNILSQEKKLDQLEVIETPYLEESIQLFFDEGIDIPSKKIILDLKNYDLRIKDTLLIKSFDLLIFGPKHIVFTGDNGTGKTTLLRKILKELENIPGIITGYMPQNYDELLPMDWDAVSYLKEFLGHDKDIQSKIMTLLGAMKLKYDEMTKPISGLSGGQRAKLFLLKLVLSKSNVLVLDEPTRNLSPLTKPIIRQILKEFKGCIISVSHDRKFIDEIGEEIYEIKDCQLNRIK